MDFIGHGTDGCRNTLEHAWILAVLLLLVLDRWVPLLPRWIYLPSSWGYLSLLLCLFCRCRRGYGTQRRDRRLVVQFVVLFRFDLVSRGLFVIVTSILLNLHIFCSNGVLQPFSQLGWWQWMYHLSPYTYVIEGLLGQALGRQSITCSDVELVTLNPPSGQTCSQYMSNYISAAGGYLTNGDATSNCEFCSTATTDQFLEASFNISYAHRWRDIGFLCAYILFNVSFF